MTNNLYLGKIGMYLMPITETSEEKAFVHFLDSEMGTLKEKYYGIYLVRNERHFKIYSFEDGKAFEPDFCPFST